MAQTGSAIVNGTCDAGLEVRRARLSRSSVAAKKGSWMERISGNSQDQQLKHAIDVGDALFQSTDIRYKVPSGPGQPTVTVWSDFEGLTYMDALLSTVYVGQADGPYRPNSNGENLQRPTISVALHGTRGTTNNNENTAIPQCCAVLALPPFPSPPGVKPGAHHNTRGTFYPVFAPRLEDYAGASRSSGLGYDALLKSLMNPSDRAQLVDTLTFALHEEFMGRTGRHREWVQDKLHNLPPIHPTITALCAVGIQCLADTRTAAHGEAIHEGLADNLAKYLKMGSSTSKTEITDLMYFMQLTTDFANEVFQNHVVGISIGHSVPRGGALQLYVNRSVRIG